MFTLVVIGFILSIFIFGVGFMKAWEMFFFIVSFHWLFVLILRHRRGQTIGKTIGKGLSNLMENNEEISLAIVDASSTSIPDFDEETGKKLSKAEKQKIMEKNRFDQQY